MKITVAGLWHLGCVTSACCARVFEVTGLDDDSDTLAKLNAGLAPLSEPGLDELIREGLATGRLSYTNDTTAACASADVLWVTYDTPVDENDEADVAYVVDRIRRCVSSLRPGTIVLISSQLPVGTCRSLELEFGANTFAYSPENLQLGKAIAAFQDAERSVVGTRDGSQHPELLKLLSPFCKRILWMRTESAEMVKHGLNGFLALSIAFINELAVICEKTGADAKEVSSGLKSDLRIGPRAYLSAGGAFAGGTLARDVVALTHVADNKKVHLDLIPAIKRSNDWHRGWALRCLQDRVGDLAGSRIALLGLTYKPNTSTLRRSSALELGNALAQLGASVRAFDPAVQSLAEKCMELSSGPEEAVKDAQAVVICTEWPDFRQLQWASLAAAMRRPLVLDANRFLENELMEVHAEYLSVGRT